MNQAACRGMAPSRKANETVDPFFPGRNEPISGAQGVCLSCPVRRACKSYSKRVGAEYGVWAGDIKRRPKAAKEQGTKVEDDE